METQAARVQVTTRLGIWGWVAWTRDRGESNGGGLGVAKGVSPVSKSVGHRMRSTYQGLLLQVLLRAQQITVDLRPLADVRAGAEREETLSRAGGCSQ